MKMHYFRIPLHQPEPQASALNALLDAHPDALVEQYLVQGTTEPCWAVCVRVLERAGGVNVPVANRAGNRHQVDYRDLLSTEQFSRFATMREFRNELAEDKQIKPYAIFTNQQLADIAQMDQPDKAGIAALNGVGEMRVEQYAELYLNQPLGNIAAYKRCNKPKVPGCVSRHRVDARMVESLPRRRFIQLAACSDASVCGP